MKKKGFLLAEETLKIVIALIGISFLIYLLFSLYSSYSDSKKLTLAKSTLDYLEKQLSSNITEIEIYNPEAWYLVSWPGVLQGLPNQCSNLGWENCLCICFKDNARECDDRGVCIKSEFKIVTSFSDNVGNLEFGAFYIYDVPVILKVDYKNKEITKK